MPSHLKKKLIRFHDHLKLVLQTQGKGYNFLLDFKLAFNPPSMIESHWSIDFLGHIMERNSPHVPLGQSFSWLPQISHVPKFELKHSTPLRRMLMLNLWDLVSNPSPIGTLGRFTFNCFCKGVKMWPLNITSIVHEFEIVHNVSKNASTIPSIP